MRTPLLLTGLAVSAAVLTPSAAEACGGFFCSQTPVDQAAERVVFTVHEDRTDMVVQISYQGRDDDFAWVLPLADVPDADALDTVPQAALNALDVATQPQFQMHPECQGGIVFDTLAGSPTVNAGGLESAPQDDGVTVHIQQEVGPYDVAVVSSDDPSAVATWLRKNAYNISPSMDPYLELYTAEKMKFLALKLTADSDAGDIVPFKLSLPGTNPGIPLRLTALAAEPEMGVKVWIFGAQRFEAANADEVEIDNADLRWEPYSWGQVNNWNALVARAVDKWEGKAWVAEMAGDTQELITGVQNSATNTPEQQEAQEALLAMIDKSPYLSRLYTRLAPEEMTYDPLFRRSERPDVARTRELPFVKDLCEFDSDPPPPVPCDYAACGALGLCREIELPEGQANVAACACAPGATARTTFAPNGSPTVSCQDQRLSFINPGDRLVEGAQRLPDPCVGFSCGDHGQCISMNLTPTCECEQGFVARGWVDVAGARKGECVKPLKDVPPDFYDVRPPERPEEMPPGRDVDVPESENPDAGTRWMGEDGDTGSTLGAADAGMPGSDADQDPDKSPAAPGIMRGGGGSCAAGSTGHSTLLGWLFIAGAAAWFRRRAARA